MGAHTSLSACPAVSGIVRAATAIRIIDRKHSLPHPAPLAVQVFYPRLNLDAGAEDLP